MTTQAEHISYRMLEDYALRQAYSVLLRTLSSPTTPTAFGIYGAGGQSGTIAALLMAEAFRHHCKSSMRGMLHWKPHSFAITESPKRASVIVTLTPLTQDELQVIMQAASDDRSSGLPTPIYRPLVFDYDPDRAYHFPWE